MNKHPRARRASTAARRCPRASKAAASASAPPCWPARPPGAPGTRSMPATTRAPTTPTSRATSCRSRRRSRARCWPSRPTTPTTCKAGQPLVRLDPADAKVALEQAEAAARADGARGAHAVRQQRPAGGADRSCARPTWRARRPTWRAPQDDVARRAAAGRHRRGRRRRAQPRQGAARRRAERAWPRRRPRCAGGARAARLEPRAHRRHDGRAAPQRAARRGARCARRMLALQRTELPAPVVGPRGQAQRAARPARRGRRAADVGHRARAACGSTPTSRKASCAAAHRPAGRRWRPTSTARRSAYHGRVEGLGAGTGAAFALLPAQNATGNWIKVVQRVPVRIALDPSELRAHPLRIGLSMDAKVDVRAHRRQDAGRRGAPPSRVAQTRGLRRGQAEADAQVRAHHRRQPRPAAPHAAADRLRRAGAAAPAASRRRLAVTAMSARPSRRGQRGIAAGAAPRLPPRTPPPLQGAPLVLGTVALSLATFMNVLDSSIANVSMPAIAGDLGVSPTQGTWVITSFARRQRDLGAAHRLADAALRRGAPVRRQRAAVRAGLVAVRPGAELASR